MEEDLNMPSTSSTSEATFSKAFSSLDLMTQPSRPATAKRDINDSSDGDDPEYFASGSEYSEAYSPSPSEYLEQGKSYTPEPSTGHNFNHRYMCIEYPGLVHDEDKMLKTLGGLDGISTALGKKNRRVELRFRPDDIYCKPACGNKHQITGLLIKVKVCRKKQNVADTEKTKTSKASVSSNSNHPNDEDPKTSSASSRNQDRLSSMPTDTNISVEKSGKSSTLVSKVVQDSVNISDDPTLPVEPEKLKDLPPHAKETKSPEAESLVSNVTVMGQLRSTYRFRNLCDFQYVPTDGSTCIYDKLLPETLPKTSWLYEPDNYFLPPAAFSRMDTMQGYWYQKDKKSSAVPRNIIGCTRQRRAGHAMFITFDTKELPKKPRPATLKIVTFKNLDGIPLAKLTKLFEERPIWSKNALITVGSYTKDQIKYLLPCVAYYFVTGPWRIMWARFGYDPRVDVSARNLQTLDYRLRTAGGLKTKVKAKRNYANYLLPYKSAPDRTKVATISKDNVTSASTSVEPSVGDDSSYIFRPGTLPPSRQMFYQYCDLHVPSIQSMLDKLPTPAPGTVCHERNGWMPHGLDFLCRDIINNLVLDTLKGNVGAQYEPKGSKNVTFQTGNDDEDDEDDGLDEDDGGSYDEMEDEDDWEMTEEG